MNRKQIVFGRVGSGMTCYMNVQMLREVLQGGKVLIMDPKSEKSKAKR